jgi:hypothetical protein
MLDATCPSSFCFFFVDNVGLLALSALSFCDLLMGLLVRLWNHIVGLNLVVGHNPSPPVSGLNVAITGRFLAGSMSARLDAGRPSRQGGWRMTWEQRFGALIELDGDEWDAAHKRLEQEWLAAYTAAFVEIAVSRGWRRENAETWPVGIGDEAFFEAYRYNWDPLRAAAEDVVACEEPP